MINNNNNEPEKDTNINAENSESSGANTENKVGVGAKDAKNAKKKGKIAFYKKRSFKYGSMATAFTAIFIAIIIILNIGLTIASDRVQLSVDLTNAKNYELSSETLNYLKKLKKPVTIKFFATKKQMESVDGDQSLAGSVKLIQQYPKYSPNISIEYIDYEKNPTAVAAYKNESIEQYDIVVSTKGSDGNERYKVIKATNLMVTQTDSSTYSQSVIGNQAEQQIDTAIDYVINEIHPTVVLTKGHDEDDASAYQSLLKGANYNVSQVNIASKDIDKNASAIAIVNPKTDFTESEIDKIDAFLKNNGKYGKNIFIYLDPRVESLPNLEAYIAEWGVKVEKGVIYDSTNSFNNAFDPIASNVDSETTGIPSTTNIGTDVRISKPLTILYEQKNERKVKSIIQTGDTSKLLADIKKSPANSDKGGPFTAMTLTTWTSGSNKSSMLVSGSYEFLDDVLLSSTNKNNKNVILGITNNLLGKQSTISVPSKYTSSSTLSLTTGQRYLTWIILVILIPLAVLLIGLVKWLRRRHL